MVEYTIFNPLGESIQTGEIDDAAVTYAKLASDVKQNMLIWGMIGGKL